MARFTPGDAAQHNGRPCTIAGYKTDDKGSTRYHIFYTDAEGGVVFDLLGRVLSKAVA